jgi:rhodanese-related sulfurtransferase
MERTFKRISTGEAREILARPDVAILDVRDPASFGAAHIPSAVNVGQANLPAVLESTRKEQPVLIYCYHGHSSQAFAQLFADFGFGEVYSLDGGYTQWEFEQRHASS